MAEFDYAVGDPLAVKLWERRIARETEKDTFVSRFIGTSPRSLIHLKTDTSKGPGDKVTCGLKVLLTGDGVTEGEDLEGNEEALDTYDFSFYINELSHAARSEMRITPQRVPFNIREEVRDSLSRWYAKRMETAVFNQLCGYTPQTNQKYTGQNAVAAPSTNRKMWVDGKTSDEACQASSSSTFNTVEYLEALVTRARTVSPMIPPLRIDGRDKYVVFLHDYQVRDMRTAKSASKVTWFDLAQAHLQAGAMKRSHIYDGAIGEYNDLIIHRSNYITNGVHSSTGAAQTNTRRAVLCGAQALAMAFGRGYSFKKFGWVEETFDYKRKFGASAQTIFGCKKTQFNSEDYGVITMTSYAAAS